MQQYDSKYGELEFDFHLRNGKYSFFILEREDSTRVFTVLDPNQEAHSLNWEQNSMPSIQDVRTWILLDMPTCASNNSFGKKYLTTLAKERLRRI